MRSLETKDRKGAVEQARRIVAEAYDGAHPFERKWLGAFPPDSYGQRQYQAELHVREGSPPKGYVLVGYGFALGVGISGELLCRVKFPPAAP